MTSQIESEHERQIVAAALADVPGWVNEAHRLRPEYFVSFRPLAAELLEMVSAGEPTDPRTVAVWLRRKGKPARLAHLMALAESAPFSARAVKLAVDTLIADAKRAALRQLAAEIASRAADPQAPVDELIAQSAVAIGNIGAQDCTGLRSVGAVLYSVVSGLDRPQPMGIMTEFPSIDGVTGGFKPGQLIVLGARPSMGKTALGIGVAAKAAAAGKTVLVVSLEMSAEQIGRRILAGLGKVNLARIATHRVRDDVRAIEAITAAAAEAHGWRLYIAESADQIEATCRRLKASHGLDFVVVDYLQLMTCRAESREQQIATISRQLKQLAKQIGVPILVMSQLNRSVEQRTDKRPLLSDLRESGAIEQDADIAMLLYRPGYYAPDCDQTVAELNVAKHRDGPTGVVALEWIPYTATFREPKTP